MDNKDYWDKVTKDTEIEWLCKHKLLSVRATNVLVRGAIYRGSYRHMDYNPIKNVKELLEIDECDLKVYRNMGTKTLEEIKEFKQKFLEKTKMYNLNEVITEKAQADWLEGYKVGFRDGAIKVKKQFQDKVEEINKLIEGLGT